MLIHHFNTFQTYEIFHSDKTYFIKGGLLNAAHAKHDLQTAIWDLLDWIRITSFTNLTGEDCQAIQKISGSNEVLLKEEIMNIICGRKLNRVFYEHAYDLIYYNYMTRNENLFVLNNEHNFFLYEEITQLMRFSTLKITSQNPTQEKK